jgi:hypothetical protein
MNSFLSKVKQIKVSKPIALTFVGSIAAAAIGGYAVGTLTTQSEISKPPDLATLNEPPTSKPILEPTSAIDTEVDLVSGDKKHSLFIKASNEASNSIGRSDFAVLVIRCEGNTTDVYVATPEYLTSDDQKVTFRWDDQTPSAEYWNGGSGGTSLFSGAPVSFIAKAIAHDTYAMNYKPYNKVKTSAQFDFDQHKDDLQKMQTLCLV